MKLSLLLSASFSLVLLSSCTSQNIKNASAESLRQPASSGALYHGMLMSLRFPQVVQLRNRESCTLPSGSAVNLVSNNLSTNVVTFHYNPRRIKSSLQAADCKMGLNVSFLKSELPCHINGSCGPEGVTEVLGVPDSMSCHTVRWALSKVDNPDDENFYEVSYEDNDGNTVVYEKMATEKNWGRMEAECDDALQRLRAEP